MFKSKNEKLINGIWDDLENPKVQENSKDENEGIPTEQIDEEVKGSEPQPTPQEKPQKNSLLKLVVVAALVGSLFGFAGGYVAIKTTSKNVILQTVNTNNATNMGSTNSGLDLQTIIKQTQPTVVEIRTETITNNFFLNDFVSEGAGSGVIVSSDGYIVTNNHVIENARSVVVTLADGTTYPAEVIGADAVTDLAVVKIDASQLTTAVLGDSDNIQVGDAVVAIGNPLGSLGGSATNGIISALNREITIDNETMYLLQTNAAVNPGNSGGGLFNDRGELIGIVNAKSSGSDIEGLGFAIPINDVQKVVTQLIQDGYVSERATLGVYLSEKTDGSLNQSTALYIEEVTPGSGAEKAQLQAGDRIISADNKEVNSVAQLKKILRGFSVGESIDLVVVRDGQEVKATVNLTQALQK